MLAKAARTDLPAQRSRVSHSSGVMKAEVLRFAKLFIVQYPESSLLISPCFLSCTWALINLHHLNGARSNLSRMHGLLSAFGRQIDRIVGRSG